MRAEHSACVGASLPSATEHPPPAALGGAPVELVPAEAVERALRATFPAQLTDRSPEYVAAFADVLLVMSATAPAVATPFDRSLASALATGRGLAGLYVSAERGQS